MNHNKPESLFPSGGLVVDARMLLSSGIGEVIQNILGRLSGMHFPATTTLLVRPADHQFAGERFPEFRLFSLPSPIYSLSEQWFMARAVKILKPAVFWSPHYNAPLLCSAPLIVTINDLCHLARSPDFGPPYKTAAARCLLYGILRHARQVVVPSEFTATEITRFFGPSFSGKISIVRYGVNSDWSSLKSSSPPDEPYFVTVGNLKPHKNLGTVISAFLTMQHRIPHRLEIIGQMRHAGSRDNETISRAHQSPDRIHLTGWIARDQLQQKVAGASAMIFPSLYEGFGFPPLEAMACGCPVIVSDIPTVREVCGPPFNPQNPDSSGSVLYFDPHQPGSLSTAMEHLLTLKPEQRQLLIDNGKKHASRFSWNDATVAYSKIFLPYLTA